MRKTTLLLVLILILISGISLMGIRHKSITKTSSKITHSNLENKNHYSDNDIPSNSDNNNDNKAAQTYSPDSPTTNNKNNTCLATQQVQYSLKKFTTKIICLENGTIACDRIEAICSVDVYNLDAKIKATFKIGYSLISNGTQLDSGFVSKDIDANTQKKIEIIFKDYGSFNISKLKCSVNPTISPTTC